MMKPLLKISLTAAMIFAATASSSPAMITVGTLSKERASEMGITMKIRSNGDAGQLVWIEFKKQGVLEKFTYAELQMRDAEGKHLVSARLLPGPVVHGQSDELTSVAFSAAPAQLKHFSFLVVAYGSTEGDVGYELKVTDFLESAVE